MNVGSSRQLLPNNNMTFHLCRCRCRCRSYAAYVYDVSVGKRLKEREREKRICPHSYSADNIEHIEHIENNVHLLQEQQWERALSISPFCPIIISANLMSA